MKPAHYRLFPVVAAGLALAVLAACSAPSTPGGILDPYEPQNRRIHDVNVALDRSVIRPVAQAYGTGVPRPARRGIANFAANLSLPAKVVNNVLQLKAEDALTNAMRFAMNTTFGLGGVLDPATDMGIPERPTDFGETLHVWGVAEGNFLTLPVLGPATERRAAGIVVDLFTNPLAYVAAFSDGDAIRGGAAALAGVDSRYEHSATIDAILYDSQDSYAQARRLYLDNRRFRLGVDFQAEEADEIDDLFGDLYDE